MKYVIVALVIMVAIGIWRNNRRKAAAPPPRPAPQKPLRQPEDMVSCAHCGVHLPASDALTSPDHRPYCSAEHRRRGPQ